MKRTIALSVAHPELPDGLIQGFRFFWAFYVNGFRPDRHCQPCFKGRRVDEFCTGRAASGKTYQLDAMDKFGYVYVCGVGSGPKANLCKQNLHMPLRYAPGESVTRTTYNGYVLTAQNAADVPIPELPDGWHGRNQETTRCRNFRFGVAYFSL